MLSELRLCSIVEDEVSLHEIITILSTGCVCLKYLSLAGSYVTDEILSIFIDKNVFPSLLCLDFTEDDYSLFYPMPYYSISPELADRISLLRSDPSSGCPFIRIDPMRFRCPSHLYEFEMNDDFDDVDDEDDDVYDNIVTYSQIPEYYSLTLPDDPQVRESYGDDDHDEIDHWDEWDGSS